MQIYARFYQKISQLCYWKFLFSIGLLCTLTSCVHSEIGQYSKHPLAKTMINDLVKEHQLNRTELKNLIAQAERKQAILDAISKPAEKTKEWHEYRPIFVNTARINQGKTFWDENAEALALAEKTYGVPAEIIVAIIGVETNYGRNKGSYRVLDALATLAFDYPPRSPFFLNELKEFILLTQENHLSAVDLTGSYAGAMGYPQFMPSSFRAYAVDFNNDGKTDIWTNITDAIGSVAHYLNSFGWEPNAPIAEPALATGTVYQEVVNGSLEPSLTLNSLQEYGITLQNPALLTSLDSLTKISPILLKQPKTDEIWLGFNNFYVITRYNHSRLYAMSVFQLASAIKQSRIKN